MSSKLWSQSGNRSSSQMGLSGRKMQRAGLDSYTKKDRPSNRDRGSNNRCIRKRDSKNSCRRNRDWIDNQGCSKLCSITDQFRQGHGNIDSGLFYPGGPRAAGASLPSPG
mmetsp:Transcript_11351/g.19867  ORF Transcript_11351/g.19867 Transcript_11351/m.19867 type:complete len:110 (+) Transcript_11351:409-738(+)